MKLSYLINALSPEIERIGDYKIYIIGEDNDNKKEGYRELPLTDVLIDEEGEEINLISNTTINQSPEDLVPLTILMFYEKLNAFMPKCADHSIFVSHPIAELGKKYLPKIDIPIVAYGISEDGKSFALFEQEPIKDG